MVFQIVKKVDQLLPLLVIDSLKHIPGASGLFIAGVFSASLSALSGGINSLAAIILEDIYKPIFEKRRTISAKEANIVAKCGVLIVGVASVLMSLVVEKLGPVLQVRFCRFFAGSFKIYIVLAFLNVGFNFIRGIIGCLYVRIMLPLGKFEGKWLSEVFTI